MLVHISSPVGPPPIASPTVIDLTKPVVASSTTGSIPTAINLLFAVGATIIKNKDISLEEARYRREGGPLEGELLTDRVSISRARVAICFPHFANMPHVKGIFINRQNPSAMVVELSAIKASAFKNVGNKLLPDGVKLTPTPGTEFCYNAQIAGVGARPLLAIETFKVPYIKHNSYFYPAAPRSRITLQLPSIEQNLNFARVWVDLISCIADNGNSFCDQFSNLIEALYAPTELARDKDLFAKYSQKICFTSAASVTMWGGGAPHHWPPGKFLGTTPPVNPFILRSAMDGRPDSE